jgi:hypothetical protein
LRRAILLQGEQGGTDALPLPAPKNGYYAVHRRERGIHHDELEPNAHALLASLARGEPLGRACEGVAAAMHVDVETLGAEFERWFSAWSARGYLVDVAVGAPPVAARAE